MTEPIGEEQPRLLFLCQTLPFPPDGGASIRTYNVLRLLSRDFQVTALCFYRRATRTRADVEASIRALKRLAHVEAFPIPQEHSRLRLIWDHFQSLLTGRVYTVAAHDSPGYRGRLAEMLRTGQFDLVHMDSLDLSAYLPLLASLPTVVVHHNVESALLRQRADAENSPVRRWYMRRQSVLMEAEERRWAPDAALNVTVSEADRLRLKLIAPPANVEVVPNGVDTTTFQPGSASDGSIVFVGGYNWFPNQDALHHFCSDILPVLRTRASDAAIQINWVGRAPADVQARIARDFGVRMTGYVDDIRPIVQRAACYIVPLRVGGGTRLKILDAWAMGKAVVSTTVGCEGLDARDGENILIRDNPDEFADAVCRVLREPGLRSRIERCARSTAMDTYDWEVIGRNMLAAYKRLIEGHKR